MLKKKITNRLVNSSQQSATHNSTFRPGSIIIAPIDDLEPEIIKLISQAVQDTFGYGTEIIALLPDVDFALNPDRNQYYSTMILEKLAAAAPDQAEKVLAITSADLFIPILTHVFGEAQIGGKACIISTYRLKEDLGPDVLASFNQRVVKEAIHELGHTFNLRHCPDQTCCMHYCRSIKDVDRKSEQFCRYCKVLMGDEIKRLAEK